MSEIDEVRNRIKNKSKHNPKIKVNKNYFKNFLYKFLISMVLVLGTLIITKTNNEYKSIIKQNVYEKNFNFVKINTVYTKYLGSILPFKDLNLFKQEIKTTFNEKLQYTEINKYNNGIKLTVEENYLVPIQESGMVVFTGNKEGYGNIVIIQQTNGVDLWYGNLNSVNVNLYDYVEKGKLLGEVSGNELYLVYQKDGEYIDYKEYIKED